MLTRRIDPAALRRAVVEDVPVHRLWMAGGLVALNILDVVLTRAILDNGGVEANPLMQSLMMGLAAPLALKAVVAGVAGLLLLCCPRQAKLGERAAVTVLVTYSLVVVWNSAVLTVLLT